MSTQTKSSPEIEAAVEKIRKLMSYANDGSASEGEIENAMGHARRLMQKFNLEEREVLLSNDKKQQDDLYNSIDQKEVYQRAGQIDPFDQLLAAVASTLCDCSAYVKTTYITNKRGNRGKGQIMVFYGLPRDIAVAQALYKELLATMRAMCKFRFRDRWTEQYTSYCRGFSGRLYQRAQELKEAPPADATDSSTCTAIVLKKDTLLKSWAKNNLALREPKQARTHRVRSEGFEAGWQDGNNADLGTRRLS